MLQPILRAFMQRDADFSQFPQDMVGSMRLVIFENIPTTVVSDGFHQVEA